MALTGKAKDYLEFKKKQSKKNSFFHTLLLNKNKLRSLRGYPFKENISAEQKDKETLEMIQDW